MKTYNLSFDNFDNLTTFLNENKIIKESNSMLKNYY